jgi:hypothetical protein
VAAFVLAFVRTRVLLPSVGVALDLFLAAALLRLAFRGTVEEVIVAAIVLAVRQVTNRALRSRTAQAAR